MSKISPILKIYTQTNSFDEIFKFLNVNTIRYFNENLINLIEYEDKYKSLMSNDYIEICEYFKEIPFYPAYQDSKYFKLLFNKSNLLLL